MNWRTIRTLVAKDIFLFFQNRFFAFITVLALVFYALIFFLMPSQVDETVEMALYAPAPPEAFNAQLEQEGLLIHRVSSEEELRQTVTDGTYPFGVALPADLSGGPGAEKTSIRLYFTSELPGELQDAYTMLVEEMVLSAVGHPLNIEAQGEILGPDLAGAQIPPRARMLPLFAVFVLVMETMGLASLITAEVEQGTIRALLVTPIRVEGLFLAKGVTGVLLAFVQVTLLLAVTGGLNHHPLLMLTALFLGSLLVTGIGFLIASVSKDMLSAIAWGIVAILILAIPSFNVLLQGAISGWVKLIPSYYLVDTVHRVLNFGAGWQDVAANLLLLLAFAILFLALGVLALRRKFR